MTSRLGWPGYLVKKVSAVWKLIAVLGSLLGFALGPGFLGQWRSTDIASRQLSLQETQAVLEMYKQMSATLEEIIKIGGDSPARTAKVDYFNAMEKELARIERRRPRVYDFKAPVPPQNIQLN